MTYSELGEADRSSASWTGGQAALCDVHLAVCEAGVKTAFCGIALEAS